jgi:hypothetical protein
MEKIMTYDLKQETDILFFLQKDIFRGEKEKIVYNLFSPDFAYLWYTFLHGFAVSQMVNCCTRCHVHCAMLRIGDD